MLLLLFFSPCVCVGYASCSRPLAERRSAPKFRFDSNDRIAFRSFGTGPSPTDGSGDLIFI